MRPSLNLKRLRGLMKSLSARISVRIKGSAIGLFAKVALFARRTSQVASRFVKANPSAHGGLAKVALFAPKIRRVASRGAIPTPVHGLTNAKLMLAADADRAQSRRQQGQIVSHGADRIPHRGVKNAT